MNKYNLYSKLVAATVAIGGFLLGFDGVVNGGAVPFYKITFSIADNPLLIGLSSSAIILGAIFGNMSAGFISDKIGRKPALTITSILFMVGAGGTALASDIQLFIITKFIAGLGVGIAILVAPMYIAEIAPAEQRGRLVTFNQLNIVLGVSVALLSNYYILKTILDPDLNWRYMLGVGFFPAAVYFLLLFLVPESPRWLVSKNRNDEALKVLKNVGGSEYARTELSSIQANLQKTKVPEAKKSIKELFKPEMRFIMFIGIALAIFQQFSGINAVLYYAPMIFQNAGSGTDAAFLMAIVVGLVFTVSTIISMFMIDRLGRKPLLIMGCSVMSVSFLLVAFTFNSGSYSIDQNGSQQILQAVESSDLTEAAKLKYPNNYITDSTISHGNTALLYKEGKVTGYLDLTTEHYYRLKEQVDILKSVLQDIEGKVFTSEVGFFDHIKSELLEESNAYSVDEVRARYSAVYKQPILNAGININSIVVLIGILGFIAGFSISLGPVMWAMFSEIFPNRIRGIAISAVGMINAIASFIVATVFPIELEYLGSGNTYFIFAGWIILCLAFTIKYIPETKGKSLEELEEMLLKKPDRKESLVEELKNRSNGHTKRHENIREPFDVASHDN